jgi:hypothetical protein
MSAATLRPRLAFRVGVSGHRDVDENDARIGAQVEALLRAVSDGLARVAGGPEAAAYAGSGFDLTLVSALAEGADRLFAAKAKAFDATLYAPLPFARDVYAEDFAERPEAFAQALDTARCFELDGLRETDKARDESYEAVGRFTVRNCDLLVAIYDEAHKHGFGGAQATAEYAARAGVRIWWIQAKAPAAPRFLASAAAFRNPQRAPEGEDAYRALAAWLDDTLKPPGSPGPERDGALGFLGGIWRRLVDPDRAPLDEFYAETPPPPRAIWRVYKLFMDLVAPDPGGYAPSEPEGSGPWTDLYVTANRLSNAYGDRYRSSYVMVAALVIVALAGAAFGGEPSVWEWVWVGAEIAGLLGIAALVAINYAQRWHERWISYRLLAELARKQRVLAPIGQSLPTADIAQLVGGGEPEEDGHAPRDAWIAWLFMAHRRACPPPTGAMGPAKQAALREGLAMVAEQLAYHWDRRKRSLRADLMVKRLSEAFFLGTIWLAFVKLRLVGEGKDDAVHAIVFLTAAVSSVATAFVGIRAYAEFALLERHSKHMIAALKAADRELQALHEGVVDRPQGSLHLGRTLYAITTEMMQDIKGWSHLFRVKRLEAG